MPRARKKKFDDGLCALNYGLDVRISQVDAGYVSSGIITDTVADQLRAALEEDILLCSEDFQAYYADPPSPPEIKHFTEGMVDYVEYVSRDKVWKLTANRHQKFISASVKIMGARLAGGIRF